MKLLTLLIVFIAGTSFSCSTSDQMSSGVKPSLTPTAESPTPTPFKTLSLAEVKSAFEKAGMPMSKMTVYSADSDPNELLGRPNQYIEKMNFADTRKRMGPDCTVEVFKNEEDLLTRKSYVESVVKAMPLITQYVYTHKNILLRLPKPLTPDQAKEYEDILGNL